MAERTNTRNRYHVAEKEIDLYDLLDLNFLRMQAIVRLLDELPLHERDFIACRYGLLDYAEQGARTFQELAPLYRKNASSLCRFHAKIIHNLRSRLQLN